MSDIFINALIKHKALIYFHIMEHTEDTKTCTIYLLTNLSNNKIYIGQTWMTLEKRMGRNGDNYSNSRYLYAAIKKYGCDNFEYTILQKCHDQATADAYESYYIELYNSRDGEIGYNLKTGGSAGKHSEETKKRISQTLKTQTAALSPEELMKKASPIAGWWAGKERGPHTDEWKEENSRFMKERHASQGHPMQGKHHSDETRLKMSAANKGRVYSQETIKKRSKKLEMPIEKQQAIIKAYQDGKTIRSICNELDVNTSGVYRVLHRHDIPLTNNFTRWEGKTHSEETKQKMAEARKAYWEDKNSEKPKE